jgi:hypothetical protein
MATCFSHPCDHHQANFYRSCAFHVRTVWDPIMCTDIFIKTKITVKIIHSCFRMYVSYCVFEVSNISYRSLHCTYPVRGQVHYLTFICFRMYVSYCIFEVNNISYRSLHWTYPIISVMPMFLYCWYAQSLISENGCCLLLLYIIHKPGCLMFSILACMITVL